jgi:hypothetical protein
LTSPIMSHEIVIIDQNALVAFLKAAPLFFFIASVIFVLTGIIILYFQARHIAKCTFWSEVQGQKTRKDIKRLAMLVERNNRDIVGGKDALEALFGGAGNFSVLQRSRHYDLRT